MFVGQLTQDYGGEFSTTLSLRATDAKYFQFDVWFKLAFQKNYLFNFHFDWNSFPVQQGLKRTEQN